jgi:hypothetical protein
MPVKSAMKTCQIYRRPKPAKFIRREITPLKCAALLARENPPSPLRIPGQDPARHPLPPPPPRTPPHGEKGGGGGQGAGLAHPCILNRYFTFIPFS